MTDERERELLRIVRTMRCRDEIAGFRQQLNYQGETLTGALLIALARQEERTQ